MSVYMHRLRKSPTLNIKTTSFNMISVCWLQTHNTQHHHSPPKGMWTTIHSDHVAVPALAAVAVAHLGGEVARERVERGGERVE